MKGKKGVSLNPVSEDSRTRKIMSDSSREEHPSSRRGRNFALCCFYSFFFSSPELSGRWVLILVSGVWTLCTDWSTSLPIHTIINTDRLRTSLPPHHHKHRQVKCNSPHKHHHKHRQVKCQSLHIHHCKHRQARCQSPYTHRHEHRQVKC